MDIRNDEDRGRFVLERDGEEAVVDYQLLEDDQTLHLIRTWVPPHLRGRGLGARLVKAALDHAREKGLRVTTSCWFVDAFLDRNPDYQDLRAA